MKFEEFEMEVRKLVLGEKEAENGKRCLIQDDRLYQVDVEKVRELVEQRVDQILKEML